MYHTCKFSLGMIEQRNALSVKVECRSVRDSTEIAALLNLCAANFPEERSATGMTIAQWRKKEEEEYCPALWTQCGIALAVGTGQIIGAVVLTYDNEADVSLSYWEIATRIGVIAAVKTFLFDHVLEEQLRPEECLIDYLAVDPGSRGQGVGYKLLEWAEQTAYDYLLKTKNHSVLLHGASMTLWVAADNEAACKLYKKAGYQTVKTAGNGACGCIKKRIFKKYLGHPVWEKMTKRIKVVPTKSSIVPPLNLQMYASTNPLPYTAEGAGIIA